MCFLVLKMLLVKTAMPSVKCAAYMSNGTFQTLHDLNDLSIDSNKKK
jgi:hypothetical protein